MSTFDPEQFLNQESDETTDTTVIPVPVGDWTAQINTVKAREIESDKTRDTYTVMDILWEILDEEVKKETGLDKTLCRQSVFIDLTDEGSIDMSKGKNRQLGLLREAVKQNKDGKPWSPAGLVGCTATVKVSHRNDPEDPENIYSEIKKVAVL